MSKNLKQGPERKHRVASLCVVATAALSACDQDYGAVVSLGTLEQDRIELVADSNEPIVRVLVHEGDRVEIGAVLVAQDRSRAEVALARAAADEAAARSALEEAESGPRQQQIAQARSRLEALASSLNTARIELERSAALAARQLASQSQVDILQGRFDEAVARRDEASSALEELMEGTRSEAIDQARSRHAAALATVRDLEITVERASIRTPVTGLVESLPFEIGERPPLGATVAVVLAAGRTYARVHVSEPLRAQLTSGAPAQVWIDAHEQPLAAHLRWIGAQAAFTPYFALSQHDRSRLSFLAEVDLDDADAALPIGIPVEVTFPGLSGE